MSAAVGKRARVVAPIPLTILVGQCRIKIQATQRRFRIKNDGIFRAHGNQSEDHDGCQAQEKDLSLNGRFEIQLWIRRVLDR